MRMSDVGKPWQLPGLSVSPVKKNKLNTSLVVNSKKESQK